MPPGRTLLLNGFMGVGKTTLGRLVAQRAGAPFIDLDEAVGARAGCPIVEIFARHGEAGFRALEAAALDAELDAPRGRVVALGGGALLDCARRRRALERAVVVTLTASPAELARRLAPARNARPLLAGGDLEARIATLLAARREAYAEAHASVATDTASTDALAERISTVWTERRVAVALGERSYSVRFAAPGDPAHAAVESAVRELSPSSIALVTDENVARLWAGPVDARLRAIGPTSTIVLPPGEAQKRLRNVESALESMIEAGLDRGSVVVALGGGVASDMAGLAAALLLRGVRWVAVPTTLLAMVDASVGGKTGVDAGLAKNAIGAFHQPSAVVIDPRFVATQSARDYASGLAEVVKTACVGDSALFDGLERDHVALVRRDAEIVSAVAASAVAVKAAIVGRDERESGERALLNFGHTLGHALEAEGGFARWTHGEAVALGMIAALRVGAARGLTEPSLLSRVTALLARLNLPTSVDPLSVERAVELLRFDKKRQSGSIRAIFLERMGRAKAVRVDAEELAAAFVAAANFAYPVEPQVD